MAMRIDTSVLRDMKTFGAFDIDACFNCGNCTAVCPLSQDSVAFPRRMIRYAQLGQKANVVASRELWLCYYCAECSDTCPRQAEPGEFMASARRFAIAGFDPTTIARRLYRSAAFTWSLLAVVFAALLVILLAGSPGWPTGRVTSEALLTFVPYETIHWLGIGVGVVGRGVHASPPSSTCSGSISRAPTPGGLGLPARRAGGASRSPPRSAPSGRRVAEVFGQMRYRDCDSEKPAPPAPLPLRRWFVHYSIMMGMIGLALATVLDYFFKTPGSYVPIWSPARLLGTVAGAFLVYGVTVAVVQRLRKADKYSSHTLLSDWLFLALLWVIGVTGFVLELADYATLGELGRRRLPGPHRPGHGADPAAAVHQARPHRLPPARHLVHRVPAAAGDDRLTHDHEKETHHGRRSRRQGRHHGDARPRGQGARDAAVRHGHRRPGHGVPRPSSSCRAPACCWPRRASTTTSSPAACRRCRISSTPSWRAAASCSSARPCVQERKIEQYMLIDGARADRRRARDPGSHDRVGGAQLLSSTRALRKGSCSGRRRFFTETPPPARLRPSRGAPYGRTTSLPRSGPEWQTKTFVTCRTTAALAASSGSVSFTQATISS